MAVLAALFLPLGTAGNLAQTLQAALPAALESADSRYLAGLVLACIATLPCAACAILLRARRRDSSIGARLPVEAGKAA
jgi:hypothetical protein